MRCLTLRTDGPSPREKLANQLASVLEMKRRQQKASFTTNSIQIEEELYTSITVACMCVLCAGGGGRAASDGKPPHWRYGLHSCHWLPLSSVPQGTTYTTYYFIGSHT